MKHFIPLLILLLAFTGYSQNKSEHGFNLSIELLDDYNNSYGFFENSRPSYNGTFKNVLALSLSPTYVQRRHLGNVFSFQNNFGITANGYRSKYNHTVVDTRSSIINFYLSNNAAVVANLHKNVKLKAGVRFGIYIFGWYKSKSDIDFSKLEFETQQNGQIIDPDAPTEEELFGDTSYSQFYTIKDASGKEILETAANFGVIFPFSIKKSRLEIALDMHHGITPYKTSAWSSQGSSSNKPNNVKSYYRSLSIGLNYFPKAK